MAQHVSVIVEEEGLAALCLDTRIGDLGVIQLGFGSLQTDALALLADSGIFVAASLVIIVVSDLKLLVVVIIKPESIVLVLPSVSVGLQGKTWSPYIVRCRQGGAFHVIIFFVVRSHLHSILEGHVVDGLGVCILCQYHVRLEPP